MAVRKKDNSSIIAALIGSVTSIIVTFMSVVLPKLLDLGSRPPRNQLVQSTMTYGAPPIKGASPTVMLHVQALPPTPNWYDFLLPSQDNVAGEIYIVLAIAVAIAVVVWFVHKLTTRKKAA